VKAFPVANPLRHAGRPGPEQFREICCAVVDTARVVVEIERGALVAADRLWPIV
jgi:hypothetical protein